MKYLFTIAAILTFLTSFAQFHYHDPNDPVSWVYLQNTSNDPIIVSIQRIGIHSEYITAHSVDTGHAGKLLLKHGEGFCIKYPGRNKWYQCTIGADPLNDDLLPFGDYVIDFSFNKKTKRWEASTLKIL